jgi:4-hydroxyphenylacetate 3-monooxygenase
MDSRTGTAPIVLRVQGTQNDIELVAPRLVVAGYTGRDRRAVQAHIDELAHIGVKPPERVPMFYELGPELLTVAPVITVGGTRTSGEVEPVVVFSAGNLYLGLGSDHTDREVEVESIAASKAAAPKPIAATVVPLPPIEHRWDDIEISCRADGAPYQDGSLGSMLTSAALLDELADVAQRELVEDTVMFCGTLPLITGEFVYATDYEMEMRIPGGPTLTLGYRVQPAVG